MTKVYFENGKYIGKQGPGEVKIYWRESDYLNLNNDDFLLFGDASTIHSIKVNRASLDVKEATMSKVLFLNLTGSKAENINANTITLWDGSSISNSSFNKLESTIGNNIVEGVVSAKVVEFFTNSSLTIAKDGVLKVPDKNALNFSKISGEGKIYVVSEDTFYNTAGEVIKANLPVENIKEYGFAVAKAVEKTKAYIDTNEQQNSDVDLLNIEMANNDNLLWNF